MSDPLDPKSSLGRRAQLKLDRQRGVVDADIAPKPVKPLAPQPESEAVAPPAGTPAVQLPPPEELDETSDFTRYLVDGVSEELRSRALKRLFALPEFNITDGLNDYDGDYTSFAPLGDMQTYQTRRLQPEVEEESPEQEDEPDTAQVADEAEASEMTEIDAEEGGEADDSGQDEEGAADADTGRDAELHGPDSDSDTVEIDHKI